MIKFSEIVRTAAVLTEQSEWSSAQNEMFIMESCTAA